MPDAVNTTAASDLASPIDLTLRPSATTWQALVHGRHAELDGRARVFRRQLGLDPDRPVVMSGHQPQFWHPGILAKLMALGEAARRTGAQAVWLVVDHDEAVTRVRYPVIEATGRLVDRFLELRGEGGGAAIERGVPLCRLRTRQGLAVPTLGRGERFGARHVAAGLKDIVGAMGRHAGEADLARQIARASLELACAGGEQPVIVLASGLAQTDLMRELVEQMADDPARCVSTYNAAAAGSAGAGVGPLQVGEDVELPLWRLGRAMGSPRRHARAGMVSGARGRELIGAGEFLPRALLLTGIMRLAGCDLFIHGLGGGGSEGEGGYDAITADWLGAWLGARLAPMAVVSATVRLRMAIDGDVMTPEGVARARWLAHAAAHRPLLLNDAEGERVRETLVTTLTKLRNKRDKASRALKRDAYRMLHQTLLDARVRGRSALDALTKSASDAAARRIEAELAADRTWPSSLYEPDQVRGLARRIAVAFDAT